MSKPAVVLYNPQSVFFTMPLAVLAVGSALDRRRYDVRVIDGRLVDDQVSAVIAALDDAVCLGVSVLTGAPIHDALRVSRAVKARRAGLPIVWGGWHPSLFPAETLREPAIDAVVTGQGEATFAELVDRWAGGGDPCGIAGAWVRGGDGSPVAGPPRPLADVGGFPAHDYSLIPIERYFARKRQRQLDYVSSQGCRFRCTFCADPFVYNRGWVGLDPARVAGELDALQRRYGFDDVGFQDETFFTSTTRVEAIADEIRRRGSRFTWYATMRADQGARLDDATLAACRDAGLRRVIVGLESGSQSMLDWMKKDLRLGQAFACADRCRRHGIGILFNLIVGFPDESDESVEATLRVARELCSLDPGFQVAIFYFKPYPGNEIAEALRASGHRFPDTLEQWAAFDYVGDSGPWVTPTKRRLVERFRFYQRVGWARRSAWQAPIRAVARWRCTHDCFAFPIEKVVADWIRPQERLS
jgi:radical SAM superfamily enzyme YgiQ (UPF0313 family)